MAVWKTEVEACAGRTIQFIVRQVVAHQVAAVVGEPQVARIGMPREADRIAHAARKYLAAAAVGVHAGDERVSVAIGGAHVARRADRHVELAVGPERDEFPAVMVIGRQCVGHDRRRGWRGEAVVDVFDAQDARHSGDEQRAVPIGDAHRHVEAGGDHVAGDDPAVAHHECMHAAFPRTDI